MEWVGREFCTAQTAGNPCPSLCFPSWFVLWVFAAWFLSFLFWSSPLGLPLLLLPPFCQGQKDVFFFSVVVTVAAAAAASPARVYQKWARARVVAAANRESRANRSAPAAA